MIYPNKLIFPAAAQEPCALIEMIPWYVALESLGWVSDYTTNPQLFSGARRDNMCYAMPAKP